MGKCRKCGKELTGIETTGWFGKLCEKCWQEQHYTQYPFKKGIDEKDKKIADLEAKLAEYQNDGVGDVIINSGKKIKELQQQLVEEKNRNKKLNHEAQKYYEDAYCNDFQNQKAIEALEKVKETAECVLDNALKSSSLNQSYYDRLLDEIDNQINELQEKAND